MCHKVYDSLLFCPPCTVQIRWWTRGLGLETLWAVSALLLSAVLSAWSLCSSSFSATEAGSDGARLDRVQVSPSAVMLSSSCDPPDQTVAIVQAGRATGNVSVKPCPHCRRKVRLSQKTARQRRQSPNSETVALFCDSVDRRRRRGFTDTILLAPAWTVAPKLGENNNHE